MPKENVTLDLEISSVTSNEIGSIASDVSETPADVALFLLTRGFSNLLSRFDSLS